MYCVEVGEAKPTIFNEDDDNIPDDSDSQLGIYLFSPFYILYAMCMYKFLYE